MPPVIHFSSLPVFDDLRGVGVIVIIIGRVLTVCHIRTLFAERLIRTQVGKSPKMREKVKNRDNLKNKAGYTAQDAPKK